MSVVFSGYSGFLYQKNWLPWYNWNIVESGVKHQNSNPIISREIYIVCYRIDLLLQSFLILTKIWKFVLSIYLFIFLLILQNIVDYDHL
jgi:hypothetical protein